MKINYLLPLILILSTILFEACSNDDDEYEEISISNFELGDPYIWNLPRGEDTFLIIRDEKEMQRYVMSKNGTEPAINFPDLKKYTLLLATGHTTSGISKLETKLIKHNDKNYTLEISICTNIFTVIGSYTIVLLVPHLTDEIKVEKKVIIHPKL